PSFLIHSSSHHRTIHSFPTRRSSDLTKIPARPACRLKSSLHAAPLSAWQRVVVPVARQRAVLESMLAGARPNRCPHAAATAPCWSRLGRALRPPTQIPVSRAAQLTLPR